MADLFISYKSEDRTFAEKISSVLEKEGFSTWWDTSLVAGDAFSDTINEELQKSKAVLVIWSKRSWESHWVKEEASMGRHLDKLVALRIDQVKVGVPFFTIHTSNFSDWNERSDANEFKELISGIRRIIPVPENDLSSATIFHFTFNDNFTGKDTIRNIELRMQKLACLVGINLTFLGGTNYAINFHNIKNLDCHIGGNNFFLYYGSINENEMRGFAEDVFLPGINKLEKKLSPFIMHIGSSLDHQSNWIGQQRLPPAQRHILTTLDIIDGHESIAKNTLIGHLTSEVVFRTLRLKMNQ